ncbi:hypothetical protein QJR26_08960 [Clostridium baratii]
MDKVILRGINNFKNFIYRNSQDILILSGVCIFNYSMFRFISNFAGYISVSITCILLGVIISKIKS